MNIKHTIIFLDNKTGSNIIKQVKIRVKEKDYQLKEYMVQEELQRLVLIWYALTSKIGVSVFAQPLYKEFLYKQPMLLIRKGLSYKFNIKRCYS